MLVGDEERRVAAGEAVLWPAGVTHGAHTEGSPMRAFVVEFSGADDRGTILGNARELSPGDSGQVPRGDGALAARVEPALERRRDGDEGEPA